MSKTIKLPLLLAVFAVGVLGVSASPALAVLEFTAKVYPVTVVANSTNEQGFEIAGATAVCMKAEFEGTASGPSTELTVHPEYRECKTELGGEFTTEVETTGCNFVFHAAGSVDIKCETGKEIHVKITGLACEIKVPGQTGLKTVEYINEPPKVKVKANITGIKWSSTCATLKVKEGSEGKYRAGELLPLPKLGSGPAEALAEGFNSKLEADEISA